MSAPADPAPPLPKPPPRWVRPLLLVAAWALLLVAVADACHRGELPALFAILVPAALLHALFGARRGIECGYTAETGALPGLLLSGVLMFVGGPISGFIPHAPGVGLLLLAAFATARADPPSPPRIRIAWALLAVVLGVWCACVDRDALGGVGALAVYAGWSAWQGTEKPTAPARRMIGMLSGIALTGAGGGADFVIVPLSVAAGLILLEVCMPISVPARRAGGPPAA